MDNLVKIVKIVPSPNELHVSNRLNQLSIKCLETGCSYVALNASLLGWHKAKAHNIRNVQEKDAEYHYHCPVAECLFNSSSLRYFKSLDIVRTHYMKVHSPKNFKCLKCEKTFGLERDCQRHEKECGLMFLCPDCGKNYSNKSALIKHCDYNKHKKPNFAVKVNENREKSSPKNRTSSKTSSTCKVIPQFILPKPTLPAVIAASPMKQQNLEIQTDNVGSLFFVTKMVTELSVSQSVQTINFSNATKSAGIQTAPDLCKKSGKARKLSIAMQTSENVCAAQTQTGDSILQSAMMLANIPVIKLCKSTQKSSSGKMKVKKKYRGKTLLTDAQNIKDASNTGCNLNLQKKHILDDIMATMSTQTNLSCITPETMCDFSETRFHHCHTQTSDLNFIKDQQQNIQISNDQITQTRFDNSYIDQITQTSTNACFNSSSVPFQDSQTQTIHELSNGFAVVNEQSGTAVIESSLSQACFNQSLQLIASNMDELQTFTSSNVNTEDDLNYLLDNSLQVMGPHDQTDILNQLLETVPSNFIGSTASSESGQPSTVSMETQTFESLATDSMTQTIEDLAWEIGTQTVEDIMADMMTQTGDDLIDYLTNDTQTQTFEDINNQLALFTSVQQNNECSKIMNSSNAIIHDESQADNASTQTFWDMDKLVQPMDLQGNSFVSPWSSPSSNSDEDHLISDIQILSPRLNVFNGDDKSGYNYTSSTAFIETENTETQTIFDPFFTMLEDLTNLENKSRNLESSQTQTTFDPMLNAVNSDSEILHYFPQNVQKETSETQTVMDLDASITRECQTPWDDFILTESSETQTVDTELKFLLI